MSASALKARRARHARNARLEVQGSQFLKLRTQNSEPRTQIPELRPRQSRLSRAAIEPLYHFAALSLDLPSLMASFTVNNNRS